MTDNRDFDRELKALEARWTEKIIAETAKVNRGLLELIAARSVVMKAVLEELDDEQNERIKARSLELAGSAQVKKYVEDWFSPSEDD